ncbi:hypothetical protein [Candidatus Aalborgicola defluviihabitans]|jgi:hypothetical protein|uniref:hypothetical protein n=1 Tax=Candidatus Aalborgicola defluviihabitans TaxID=3386187 RepID=UPI001DE2CB16|nr:hypothetical protein [Burkholderiales bacterium]MBK6568896.1 hypothetical protein [Burkholderiales bacterium]MBK7281031.1 hypothetical protein [Burkholderiales bacterium]MBK7313708.1 hypothetical protein [Burkholderiales bacterium]MBL0245550.1 hypothetical protein [Rhodoferax sp.]
MKKFVVLALMAGSLVPALALAQTSVGMSIGINQPGVYGRIDIGGFPQPRLIYPQPMVIRQSPIAVYQQPIYLYVPPGHQKNWAQHCARYNACGQPVYFVQEQWVRERYEERRGYQRRGYRDNDRGHDRDDHDRGRGHGKGNRD